MVPDGATLVITGATSGIGLETARELAARAKRIVVQGPETDSAASAALRALDEGSATVRYVSCNFERMSDVVAGEAEMARAADVRSTA